MGNTDINKPAESLALTWDEYHNNPNAEIVLVSSDNVGFRVDAWYLAKQSAFVASLIGLPSGENLRDSPITLTARSSAIRHFIDLVVCSSPVQSSLDTSEFKALLDVCDYLQAPKPAVAVTTSVRLQLAATPLPAGLDPWDIFKIAAYRDDVGLAKAAIRAFGQVSLTHDQVFKASARHYAGIPGPWVAALLKQESLHKERGHQYSFTYRNTQLYGEPVALSTATGSWDEVAEAFEID